MPLLPLQLPSHVKTVLISGAGGYVGQELTKLILSTNPQVELITTDIRAPEDHGEKRVKAVAADLSDVKQVEALLEGKRVQAVFALHGIMSGQSEKEFEFGYSVNIHSHLNLISAMRRHASQRPSDEPLPIYVNVSSLAVYGGAKATPTSKVVPKDTPIQPETSYGVSKHVVEMITYDHARKGLLDGRTVRLPSVVVRSGKPSSAASSFMSGLIREPLQGIPSVVPLADSPNDSILDDWKFYLTRQVTVVSNILRAASADKKAIEKVDKTLCINLPGIAINTRDILNALEQAGGKKALELVSYKSDPAVKAIVNVWAGDYENEDEIALGFAVDDKRTGYMDAVKEFQKTLAVN